MKQISEVIRFLEWAIKEDLEIQEILLAEDSRKDFEALSFPIKANIEGHSEVRFSPNGTDLQPELYKETALLKINNFKSSGHFFSEGASLESPSNVKIQDIKRGLQEAGFELYDFRIDKSSDEISIIIHSRTDRLREVETNIRFSCPLLTKSASPDTVSIAFEGRDAMEWHLAYKTASRVRQAPQSKARSTFQKELKSWTTQGRYINVYIRKNHGVFPFSLPYQKLTNPYYNGLLEDIAELGYSLGDISNKGIGESELSFRTKLYAND